MCTFLHVYVCASAHVCIYGVCTFLHVCVSAHVCMCICVCVCTFLHMCVRKCVRVLRWSICHTLTVVSSMLTKQTDTVVHCLGYIAKTSLDVEGEADLSVLH